MSEAASRKTVIDNFRAVGAHCQRIEDSYSIGVPDLNLSYRPNSDIPLPPQKRLAGSDVWIEFKHLEGLPKRPTTPIKVGLRQEQYIWLTKRAEAGGRVAVLTKIEPQTWLLHTSRFRDLYYGLTLPDLCGWAVMFWSGDFKNHTEQVLRLLTDPNFRPCP